MFQRFLSQILMIDISDSFQNEVDDSMDGVWEAENLIGKEKEWESWEEASITQSQSDCASIPENVFDIMREGYGSNFTNL